MSKMKMNMPNGLTSLLKDGYKHFSGLEEAIMRNIEACKMLAAITRTSLGPNGMNKLVVNHLEKIFVTSDAATIVQELEIAHPAAKMMTMAAKMQEQEVGDGTNLVITFAGELLNQAEALLRLGVHPSEIVEGYKKASETAFRLLDDLVVETLGDPRDVAVLKRALAPVIASKHMGYEGLLAGLVTEAVQMVLPAPPRKPLVTVDNVRVAKLIGGSVGDSQVLHGVVALRDAEGSVKSVTDAKIVVFGCSIESSATETKGTVVIKSADELMAYNKGEEKLMEEAISGIAATGARVVVVGGSISEIAMHFIEKHGMMAIKIMSKFELRRLCKAVGATALVRVGPPLPEELGHATSVSVQELSSRTVTVFRADPEDGEGGSSVATIVLRGATMNVLDDMERAIDDAVNVARVLCARAPESGRLVPGAGATEIELAARIADLAAATPGLDQYAIARYAEALEVVPRILAENSGQIATDTISALYAAHAAGKKAAGVDIDRASSGVCPDVTAVDILDSHAVKLSALRMASEVAITILRVDTIIMSKAAGGPKPRQQGAADGGDDD